MGQLSTPFKTTLFTFLLSGAACVNHNSEGRLRTESEVYSEEVTSIIDSLKVALTDSMAIVEEAIKIGEQAFLHAESKTADDLFHYALLQSPEYTKALEAYGKTSAHLGRFKESQRIYEKILQLDSLYLDAYGSLVTIHLFQDQKKEAQNLLQQWMSSKDSAILREVYSAAAVLAIYDKEWDQAVAHLEKRLAITDNIWDIGKSVLDHPYWDMHLIGNILLHANKPEEALAWYKKGLTVADSTLENGRPLRIIKSDFQYFMAHYLVEKSELVAASHFVKEGIASNPNGFGSHWARILVKQNQADSALIILDKYCRNGYYKQFLKGKTYESIGDHDKARSFYKSVEDFYQVGNRYWQHEYALIQSDINH